MEMEVTGDCPEIVRVAFMQSVGSLHVASDGLSLRRDFPVWPFVRVLPCLGKTSHMVDLKSAGFSCEPERAGGI